MALRGMLQSQVESSQESVHHLVSSSTVLTKTNKEMEAIGAGVKVAGGLISKYERREFTDKVLIFCALILYFGVVLYILQKRLLGWLW